MDPMLSKRTNKAHAAVPQAAPPSEKIELDAPFENFPADKIAAAVIVGRPYESPSRIASVTDRGGKQVFGDRMQYPQAENVIWSDSAAEEVFARMYQASTVRSRNFRVWIVAQALTPVDSSSAAAQVLAEVRRVHAVFVDPGTRAADGGLIAGNVRVKILATNEF